MQLQVMEDMVLTAECAFMLSTLEYLAFLGLYIKLLKGFHL